MENRSYYQHKVKRAIVLAAGYGNRMLPLTKSTPKPLIKVHGKAMIETIIDALIENEILEIYVVTGHLKDQFVDLTHRYPHVALIDNPYYYSANNISSLFVARNYLEDVMIIDGDQVVSNSSIFAPYFNRSGYNCVWNDNKTTEWVLTLNSEGIVVECSPEGADAGWQLYSISRWSAEDGKRLRQLIETEFLENKNQHIFWDAIPLLLYPNAFSLGITEMKEDDVLEIDEFSDLIRIDPSHQL